MVRTRSFPFPLPLGMGGGADFEFLKYEKFLSYWNGGNENVASFGNELHCV